jgi:hypothetical protein
VNEADRIAARLRRLEAELREAPDPITEDELDAALAYARRVGAPVWLVRLLEAHRRRDDAAGIGR